jgi:membrane-bound metal-dependent hydrolase YbcI (DUF457 family)
MFIGHFAVGFASKRIAPRASLAPLLAAPLFADLLWPVFLLLGVEHVRINPPGGNPFLLLMFTAYPWSHSLAMSVVWAGVCAGAYFALTRYGRGAVVIALAVVSHWALDYVTHLPDLPLAPGMASLVGLGLWRSVPATVAVEGAMFVAGVWLYSSVTTGRDGVGRYGWWALVVLTAAAYVGNLQGSAPPSVPALAWTAVIGSVITLWLAWWADRHRAVRGT